MKKTVLLFALGTMIISCNQKTNENQNAAISGEQKEQPSSNGQVNNDVKESFKIENIAYSNADLGNFPFFTLPEGLKEQNKPLQKKFDVCFFPINGIMTPFEGKLYKANITAKSGEEFSQRYFEKSIEDYMTAIGAVKVFDGKITTEEYDRYNKQDPNKGNEGDIGYSDEQIKFYLIRSKDKGNIYVQFSSNNAGGKLHILQEEAFKQTITKVTADEIAKDLTEKGKSILYINFDIDKSTISTDGIELVNEIATALKKNTSLKIAIEGHTDNTGDAAHNKKLSNDRANAVLRTLATQGIDKSRLSAKGFGAERPLVANNSEDNKSKNRRVELIKMNK